MDLVDGPESAHLMTGPVEPVVATVQQEGGEQPGGGTVPGQAGQSVLLVEAGVTSHHQHPGHQPAQGHQEAAGDARHTARCTVSQLLSSPLHHSPVSQVLRFVPHKMIDSRLHYNHQGNERDGLHYTS